MPAVIATELRYNKNQDTYNIYLYLLLERLQVIQSGYYLSGRLEFCRIDKKVEKEISEPIMLEVKDSVGVFDIVLQKL